MDVSTSASKAKTIYPDKALYENHLRERSQVCVQYLSESGIICDTPQGPTWTSREAFIIAHNIMPREEFRLQVFDLCQAWTKRT